MARRPLHTEHRCGYEVYEIRNMMKLKCQLWLMHHNISMILEWAIGERSWPARGGASRVTCHCPGQTPVILLWIVFH